jgi:hypothetical protein
MTFFLTERVYTLDTTDLEEVYMWSFMDWAGPNATETRIWNNPHLFVGSGGKQNAYTQIIMNCELQILCASLGRCLNLAELSRLLDLFFPNELVLRNSCGFAGPSMLVELPQPICSEEGDVNHKCCSKHYSVKAKVVTTIRKLIGMCFWCILYCHDIQFPS